MTSIFSPWSLKELLTDILRFICSPETKEQKILLILQTCWTTVLGLNKISLHKLKSIFVHRNSKCQKYTKWLECEFQERYRRGQNDLECEKRFSLWSHKGGRIILHAKPFTRHPYTPYNPLWTRRISLILKFWY